MAIQLEQTNGPYTGGRSISVDPETCLIYIHSAYNASSITRYSSREDFEANTNGVSISLTGGGVYGDHSVVVDGVLYGRTSNSSTQIGAWDLSTGAIIGTSQSVPNVTTGTFDYGAYSIPALYQVDGEVFVLGLTAEGEGRLVPMASDLTFGEAVTFQLSAIDGDTRPSLMFVKDGKMFFGLNHNSDALAWNVDLETGDVAIDAAEFDFTVTSLYGAGNLQSAHYDPINEALYVTIDGDLYSTDTGFDQIDRDDAPEFVVRSGQFDDVDFSLDLPRAGPSTYDDELSIRVGGGGSGGGVSYTLFIDNDTNGRLQVYQDGYWSTPDAVRLPNGTHVFYTTKGNLLGLESGPEISTTFGTDGYVTLSDQTYNAYKALEVSGEFIYAFHVGDEGGDPTYGIERFAFDGQFDTAFGTDGRLELTSEAVVGSFRDAKFVDDAIYLISTDSDASTISVAKFGLDFEIDTSFGTSGVATVELEGVSDGSIHADVASDGAVTVGAVVYNYYNYTQSWNYVRFDASGSVDLTFGDILSSSDTKAYAATYLEGEAPVQLMPRVDVVDSELQLLGNYGGASITAGRQGGANTADVFGFADTVSIADGEITLDETVVATFVQSDGQLTVTMADGTSHEQLNSVAEAITYTTVPGIPSGDILIDVIFSDNTQPNPQSSTATVTVAYTSLNATPVGAPMADLANGTEDESYEIAADDLLTGFTDPDGDTLQIANLSTSVGDVVDNSDGTFTLTLAANANGDVTLTYDVIDGNGGVLEGQTQTVTFDAINDVPEGTPTAEFVNGIEDEAYTLAAADLLTGFTDADGDTLAVTNLVASAGDLVDNGDGTFTLTPAANFNGDVTLTHDVSDGNGGVLEGQTQTVTFDAVNDAPVGWLFAFLDEGREDQAYTFGPSALLAGFTDVDGDDLLISALEADGGSLSTNEDGSWTLRPDADFSGTITLRFMVSDGAGSQQVVYRHVAFEAVNDAPTGTASDVVIAGVEDQAVTLELADLLDGFTDADGDALTVFGLTASAGDLTENGDGSFTLTPPADFAGEITVSFAVSDSQGGLLGGQARTVTFDAVNDKPTVLQPIDNHEIEIGRTMGRFDVSSMFEDADSGDTLSFAVDGLPDGLSFDGTMITGWVSEAGAFDVRVTATDGQGQSAQHSFSLTASPNDRYLSSFIGTDQTDQFEGTFRNEFFATGDGDDVVAAGRGFDMVLAGDGADTVLGGDHSDSIYGEAGNDYLLGESGADRLFGGDGADRLAGGADNDSMFGEAGDDVLFAFSGNDYVDGGAGNDRIYVSGGNHTVDGGDGDDSIVSRDVHGVANVSVVAGAGDDKISLASGTNTIDAGDGDDTVTTIHGDNTILGGAGNDSIRSISGRNFIDGGDGDDRISGGSGNDEAFGGAGNDVISGNAGYDIIGGDAGDDTLSGGMNWDRFVFNEGFGNDVITDFEANNWFERLDFRNHTGVNSVDDIDVTASGADTVLTVGEDSITLKNVAHTDINSDDFLF